MKCKSLLLPAIITLVGTLSVPRATDTAGKITVVSYVDIIPDTHKLQSEDKGCGDVSGGKPCLAAGQSTDRLCGIT
jgi:hypothetical protein